MSREERLAEFFRRLLAASPCSDAGSAFAVLSQTLTAVEDEFSGVPNDPSRYRSDGRLYPPQADAERSVPGRTDVRRYRSVAHNTYISDDGAILITDTKQRWVFSKPASNGATIDLQGNPKTSAD